MAVTTMTTDEAKQLKDDMLSFTHRVLTHSSEATTEEIRCVPLIARLLLENYWDRREER